MVNNKVAIIIPVYNEEKVIRDVIKNVLKNFSNIICVDDGSTDSSLHQIEKTDAYLVKHPINMGQGAALQTGIEFARQLNVDYFVTFDADGQHKIADVESMLKVIKNENLDIILGSRFLGETIGIKRSKYLLLKAAVVFSNATSGLKLTDTHNGIRLFNRRVAENMEITQANMSHASEILEIIGNKKFSYKEIPVTIEYTEYSMSKGQSVINAINIAFDTLLRKMVK